MNKKIIYVSGPYTKGDVSQNVKRAIDAGDKLLEMGYIPFVPHLLHYWHIISPKSYETWLEIDRAIVPFCDAVLRLDGISRGADEEVALAFELGIPVYYSLKEVS